MPKLAATPAPPANLFGLRQGRRPHRLRQKNRKWRRLHPIAPLARDFDALFVGNGRDDPIIVLTVDCWQRLVAMPLDPR